MKRSILLLLLSLCAMELSAQSYSDLYRNTPNGGPVSSGELPQLVAYTQEGEQIELRELCKDRYTLLVMGCITCPEFRRAQPSIEAINADYAPLGLQTFYIFKNLRHPELGGYVEPQNIAERQMMVKEIKSLLGGDVTWLIDDMSDNISQTLLSGSRSAYLISPQGEILTAWGAPMENALRQSLTKSVGVPATVTPAETFALPAATARVERRPNVDGENSIAREDGLVIVKSTPTNPEDIYFIKMRAEADVQLLDSGTGRLALSFLPDPLYDAHWNNLAAPMKYTISAPKGVKITPQEASAKRGKGDSDSDPRQFWVDIKGASPTDKIEITYHYYGCSPDMCEAFTHSYIIELTPEAKGASTFGFNKGSRGGNSRGGSGGGGGNRGVNGSGNGARNQQGRQQSNRTF